MAIRSVLCKSLLFSICLAGGAASAQPAAAEFSDAWYEKARTLHAEGRLQEAANILQVGADAGDIRATSALVRLHYGKAEFPGKDPAKVLPLLERLVELGHLLAATDIAAIYQQGTLVPKDDVQGFLWTKRAAEGGIVAAYAPLGVLYQQGLGVPQDLAKGLYWLQRSVEAGEARGMHALGLTYLDGIGVEQDPERGVQLLERSAKLGYDRAINGLPDARKQLEQHRAATRPPS